MMFDDKAFDATTQRRRFGDEATTEAIVQRYLERLRVRRGDLERRIAAGAAPAAESGRFPAVGEDRTS
jgi:hypothetical protein